MERGRIGPTDYEWTRGKENVFKIRKRFEEGLKRRRKNVNVQRRVTRKGVVLNGKAKIRRKG